MASFLVSMFMVVFMIPAASGKYLMMREEGKQVAEQQPLAADERDSKLSKKGHFTVIPSGSVKKEEVSTDDLIQQKTEVGRAGKGEPTITMEYGGVAHGNAPHNGNVLARPEAVRSQTCNNGACQDCTSRANCWHGVEISSWGYMALTVAAGASFTHYIAEVWAKCSSSVGTWYFRAYEVTNGEVVLTRNGDELHRTSQPDSNYKNLGLPVGGQARMRVSFAHTNKNQAASCRFYLEAYDQDPSVDTCMSAKECLAQLGDGTDAAYALRNGNTLQMHCLKGDRSSMSSALKAKCEVWDGCVEGTGKKVRLLALLKAASVKPGSLIAGRVTENTTLNADNCVSPDADDPESWDCECADQMFGQCSSSSNVEGCVQALMCNNPNVCGSWKQDYCASSSSSLLIRRSAKNGIDDHLDSTIQGKCAE